PKPETLADFAQQVHKEGCFIVGRKTFEAFRAGGGPNNPFANIDIVVVSHTSEQMEGARVVRTPQEAIAYLESKGHTTTLTSGGEQLHNSFLAAGLIDEVIFNIAPVMESKGLKLHLPEGSYGELNLLNCTPLGNGVVQLHYDLKK
ncbi:MAG: dihydrofolate reductase, partial [Sphingobacteriales bacterium]